MDDLTPAERRLVTTCLRTVASMLTSARSALDSETLIGLADKIEIGELAGTIHEIRARADKAVRDALVEQTQTLIVMADNLSGSLGACVALLAAIDEIPGPELPTLAPTVESGRVVIQAWQEAKPHIFDGLAALDDPEPS